MKTRDKVDADSRGAPRNVDDARHIAAGREVVRIESQALSELLERIGSSFAEAVRAIVASPGTVVVLGLGKSGIVARKLAATLASTGTRAVFLHPADAAHGDVGMVAPGDVGVVVSKRQLIEEVWKRPYGGSDKTVDVHISWLRRKLGETAADTRFLETVYGVGIKLVDPT